MNTIVRAWKDPTFRATLSRSQMAKMPVNPAGERGLDASALARPLDPEGSGTMLTNLTTKTLWCCDPTNALNC